MRLPEHFRLTYRKSYYLRRPWEIAQEIYQYWCAFWQRGRRGWANSDAWNTDYYLAQVCGPMLRYLAEDSHGIPPGFDLITHAVILEKDDPDLAAWRAYLCEIAAGFEAYLAVQDSDDQYTLRAYEPSLAAMQKLFDYYPYLWS